jgi:hypothetical protein
MEEATELFGLMDGMIRMSETRLAMVVAAGAATPGSAGARKAPPKPKAVPAGTGVPDDLLWLAILGAGAGAGVLAAIAKKAGESMAGTPIRSASKNVRKSS